jgi:hypothetical protein
MVKSRQGDVGVFPAVTYELFSWEKAEEELGGTSDFYILPDVAHTDRPSVLMPCWSHGTPIFILVCQQNRAKTNGIYCYCIQPNCPLPSLILGYGDSEEIFPIIDIRPLSLLPAVIRRRYLWGYQWSAFQSTVTRNEYRRVASNVQKRSCVHRTSRK